MGELDGVDYDYDYSCDCGIDYSYDNGFDLIMAIEKDRISSPDL